MNETITLSGLTLEFTADHVLVERPQGKADYNENTDTNWSRLDCLDVERNER